MYDIKLALFPRVLVLYIAYKYIQHNGFWQKQKVILSPYNTGVATPASVQ